MATNYISIVNFGAVGDGKTDNTAAIQKAFDYAATNHVAVYIPTGTFKHTGVLKANGIDVYGNGDSSVLYATGTQQMLQLSGDSASLKNVALDSNATVRSPGTAEEAKLHVFDATNFEISGVTIKNSMSVGILVRESSQGWIHGNNVSSTGSDGMRMTKNSHDIRIEQNTVSHAGDDSIAVISTASATQDFTKNIEIVDNKVYDNDWGRGISVVGGAHVKIVNNLVDGNLADRAGIYIASESDYNTKGVEDVLVQGNTVLDTGSSTTQPSVLVYNGTGLAMTGISIHDNKIVPPTGAKAFSIKGTADVAAHDNGPDAAPALYSVASWTGTATDSLPTTSVPAPTPTPTPTELSATFKTASFTGADASELIVGNALDNTIFGRGGNDTIYGGAGNDRIEGNSGNDVLHGGAGNDVFIIGSSSAMHETILDFTKGHDKIDLGERDANTVKSGWQDFTFIGSHSFSKPGELRVYQDAAKGITVIEGNTDSDLTPEMHIECKGLIAFQAIDFIL